LERYRELEFGVQTNRGVTMDSITKVSSYAYHDNQSFKLKLCSLNINNSFEVSEFLENSQKNTKPKDIRITKSDISTILKQLSDSKKTNEESLRQLVIYRASHNVNSNQMSNELWANVIFLSEHPVEANEWCLVGYAKARLSKKFLKTKKDNEIGYTLFKSNISEVVSNVHVVESALEKLLKKKSGVSSRARS
jgi:hypothetical protein